MAAKFWARLRTKLKGDNKDERHSADNLETEKKEVSIKHLCEAGRYAYAFLCAHSLKMEFESEFPKFCNDSLNTISNHLSLSDEVKKSLFTILNGDALYDDQPMVDSLKDSHLRGNIHLLIQDIISLGLEEAEYDARWRVFVRRLARSFNINNIEPYELAIADFVLRGNYDTLSEEEKNILNKRLKVAKIKRYGIIIAATIAGGAIVGFTGGLATPLIAESLGTLIGATAIGSSAVTALGSTSGAVFIGSLFGTAGASFTGFKTHKRVCDVKEFAVGQLCEGGMESSDNVPVFDTHYLSLTIAISGWITDHSENNFAVSWKRLFITEEQYFLRYESKYLLELNNAFNKTSFITAVKSLIGSVAMFKGVTRAFAWPAILLDLSSIIDFPWSVCCDKAILVGRELAVLLLSRNYGRRPVTLIGYSMGARVIYYCLLEMLERGAEGIIEDVYLIGAPCPADPGVWSRLMNIISGTLTNAYSDSDFMLQFFYRTLSLPKGGIAGLKNIDLQNNRLRNVNLSKIISGHFEYASKIELVLKELNVLRNEKTKYISMPSTSST